MGAVKEFLVGKTIFMTGATGFLGQPLVEKILWSAPDVKRIYVLIRPKHQFGGRVLAPQERLEKELYGSSVFERLQSRYKHKLIDFLREKLIAVPGDISMDNLGLTDEQRERFRQEVDVVINSAAVVSFDAPLDESLELNVYGAKRLTEFASACDHAILIHVSTAYTCGAAVGDVPESLHHSATSEDLEQFPERRFQDIDLEVDKIRELIDKVRAQAEERETRREITEAFVKRTRRWKGRRKVRRRQEIGKLKRKWLSNRLSQEGMSWARKRGWNDTYTYTKALGEQFVCRHRGSVPTAIVRPSVIESSLSEPSPGWLDGLRMADPLIVAIGKGRLRSLPLNPDVSLDLVPVDMVVNAILAVMPKIVRQPEDLEIIQVATGSRNPITLRTLYELIFRYFDGNPMLDKVGNPIQLKPLKFPKPSTFRLQHRLKSVPLYTAEKTLERIPLFEATQRAKRRISATKAAHEKLYYYGEIYEPYLNLSCRFLVDRAMAIFAGLDEQEKREFNFDVERLNWRHYVQNVHIPGVKKFILKIEGTGALEIAEDSVNGAVASTIPELLKNSVVTRPNQIALQIKRNGKWARFTNEQVLEKAEEVARNLLRVGLKKGDRVVLFSENQPEWGICYLGASIIGLIVVPIDSQTWHREVWGVTEFTGASAILGSAKCLDRLPEEGLTANEEKEDPVTLLNVNSLGEPFDLPEYPLSSKPSTYNVPEKQDWPIIEPDDPASIIFTTGTSVDPKGAVHTHRNFLSNLRGANHYLTVSESDKCLSVLPLYHALEFTCGFLAGFYGGATVTYMHSLKPRLILETMRETGTTCMLGVPTLYALIREDIERRVLKTSKSAFKSNVMQTSKQVSHSVERRLGRNIGRRLFSRVNQEFGGQIRLFVSGGSSLGTTLYGDFRAMGMPIYEGYGLTETAPVLTVNPLHRSREGSAGKPLPGVEMRLYQPDQDGIGEIIVRTPSLMREYYQNPEATEYAIRDGWFHTGDLGWFDADGYVYLTGRLKDVIVTGAGKNVYPSDVEATYLNLPIIEEICVFGVKSDLTEDVYAVIYPRSSKLEGVEASEVKKTVQKAIQGLARELPSYHRLQSIHIWEEKLPRTESGAIDRKKIRDAVIESKDGEAETPDREVQRHPGRKQSLFAELSRLSGVEVDEIEEESNLYTDLGLDSLMAVELLLFLERELNVVVSDEKVAGFQTVGDVLDELRKQGISGVGREQQLSDRESEDRVLLSTERPAFDSAVLGASFTGVKFLFNNYFGLEVHNREVIPSGGPYILAANHSSHLDTAAVVAALSTALGVKEAKRVHVIGARDYFFNSPLKSWVFSTCLNVVPIERDEISLSGLRKIGAILKAGEPILIFPEGTRSRSGALQDFKPGIGLIAVEFGVPILPIFISGTYKALPAGKSVPKREKIKVRFGNVIAAVPNAIDESATRDETYRKIAQDVRVAVRRLSQEAAES